MAEEKKVVQYRQVGPSLSFLAWQTAESEQMIPNDAIAKRVLTDGILLRRYRHPQDLTKMVEVRVDLSEQDPLDIIHSGGLPMQSSIDGVRVIMRTVAR